jgi:hypothetical protein
MTQTILVLYSDNLEELRKFWEARGCLFTEEKRGSGPRHYASSFGATLLELYPAESQGEKEGTFVFWENYG